MLDCSSNQLTLLPALNQSLQGLDCSENQLISLPTLNKSLLSLYCSNNLLPILIQQGWLNKEQKNNINNALQCLKRFIV